MLDYDKVVENAIRFIDSMSKDEWIAFLKEGGLLRDEEEPEVWNDHRPIQLLYGGDWYDEYFVDHGDEDQDNDDVGAIA